MSGCPGLGCSKPNPQLAARGSDEVSLSASRIPDNYPGLRCREAQRDTHRYNSADSHAYPSGHRGDDCHAHAVFDTHAYYDAGTNPEGYRSGHSGPYHHSRTDGDPGANGYRCPYCNSHTNSYSYASAANSYSYASAANSYSYASAANSYSYASAANSYSYASAANSYSYASAANSYSYASAANSYSHTATPGE